MTADRVEYVELVESTGDTTRRALFRVYERDEHLFSVGVGLARTAARTLGMTDEDVYRRLPEFGRRHIERHLASNPGWEATNLGRTDAALDVTTGSFDPAEFKSIAPAP